MNLRDRDAQARSLAQTEFSKPVIMEAGAGTGKTATLVARILAWSLSDGWDKHSTPSSTGALPPEDDVAAQILDRIVAITFTERAAAEMAERVTDGLVALHRGGEPIGFQRSLLSLANTTIAHRAGCLLKRVDHLRITTIHSFCRSILASFPLEAGWHPGFQVDADGSQLRKITEDLLREYAEADADDYPPDLTALYEEGVDLSHIHDALGNLLEAGISADSIPADPYPASHMTSVIQELRTDIALLVSLASKPMETGKRVQSAQALLDALDRLKDRLDSNLSPEELIDALDEFQQDARFLKRLQEWGKGKFTGGEGDALGTLDEDVTKLCQQITGPLAGILRWNPRGLRAGINVLRLLLEQGQQRCKEEGWIPFSMLLKGTRELLVAQPGVAREVTSRIDQLLIDEFQDTNPTQCDVVRALALGPNPQERPGLYLVGDPKQSIYGWRQADLRAYTDFVEEVRAAGGTKEVLAVNYRSVPAILSEVERVHAPLMGQTPKVSPPFEQLLPCEGNLSNSGFSSDPWRPVEYWTCTSITEDGLFDPKSTAEGVREQEAKALAADLVRLRKEHGLQWKDVAIIMRTRTPMETYLKPLREVGIPYLVERDRSYYQRREVIDGLSLLRVLSDPHDHVALVGLLRSPWMGVPDRALAPLIRHGVPAWMGSSKQPNWSVGLETRVAAALADTKPLPDEHHLRGWAKHLTFALQQIHSLQHSLTKGKVTEFITGFRGLLGRYVTEGAHFLGSHRVANLRRMERQLVDALQDNSRSLEEIFTALKRGFLEGKQEEEGVPGDESMDAVRLLTIHSSKGLTFEHVYLVNLHGVPKAPSRGKLTSFTHWNGEPAFCVLNWPSVLWSRAKESEALRETGESIRNLYVAMTRPKKRLVLMGNFGNARVMEPMKSATFAELLTTRFAAGDGKTAPLALEKSDQWNCRWSFPALSAEPLRSVEKGEESARSLTLAEARRSQTALRAHRVAAQERMQKPLFQTPSGLGKTSANSPLTESPPLYIQGKGSPVGAIIGTLVHEFLERLSQTQDGHFDALLGELPDWIQVDDPTDGINAIEGARAILELLRNSAILRQFKDIDIQARELPLLISSGPRHASTTLSGTIDLLYRTKAGDWVVADYKSDMVPAGTSLETYGQQYLQQGALYVQAVQEALQLDRPPRFELWFLRYDKVVEMPTAELEKGRLAPVG